MFEVLFKGFELKHKLSGRTVFEVFEVGLGLRNSKEFCNSRNLPQVQRLLEISMPTPTPFHSSFRANETLKFLSDSD
jgi:hypothetical protein